MKGVLSYFAGEALTSMNRSRGIASLAVVTIAIALAMLGGFVYLTANLQALVVRWTREVQVHVYLVDGLAAADRQAIEQRLRDDPRVEQVTHVSKEEALRRFQEYFADLGDLPEMLATNPLPASLEVRLAGSEPDPAEVRLLAESIAGAPGVEDVEYDTGWVERLHSMIRIASASGYVVGGLLLLAATFTTSNVIRLALYSRRDEVEILQLVGATRGFIQGPFLVEGLLQGLAGGLLALAVLAVVHLAVRAIPGSVGPLVRIATDRFLEPGPILGLIVAGAAMGLCGSLLAVRRFLASPG